MITKASKETKLQSETASEVFYEEKEGEEAGLIGRTFFQFWLHL